MIPLNRYKNKHIGVIGFGKTGRSIVEALEKNGVRVSLHDDLPILDSKYQNLNLNDLDWNTLDFLVVSPGINLLWPNKHLSVKLAQEHFIPIINDVDLFQQHVPGKKICVTGTNGKSTTAALIHHVFNLAGEKSALGGNFGNPVLSLNTDNDFYVLELSSYQLESCHIFGFDTAVLLNITPDHLTRHGGMSGYIATKQKIFANFNSKSNAVIGIDDEYCSKIFEFLRYLKHPNIIPISGQKVVDFGIGWNNDELIDNRFGKFDVICHTNNVFDGVHNRQNMAAAYATCAINGISRSDFCNGLFSFDGLEHRQEFVKNINGIQYINDSKATNADSVEYALKRFDDILWILGGRPKENGISTLIKYFYKVKFAFLIGEAAQEWSQFLEKNGLKNEISHTLDAAINHAYEMSRNCAAKVVLFSPACASFDQFKNFEDRGNKFKKLVGELKERSVHD